MIPAIRFDDYETISDTLLILGQGCFLKMVVQINRKSNNNERIPFSQEYLYRTNKYVNKDKVVSAKRGFFPYLAIEYKDASSPMGKETIRITHYDILGFQSKVLEADKLAEECFALKRGKLIIPSDKHFEIKTLQTNSTITFSPVIVMSDEEGHDAGPGMRFGLNNHVFINSPIRTWKAFMYYIQMADLYGWAASIVSGYSSSTVGEHVMEMQPDSKHPTVEDTYVEDVGFRSTKRFNNGVRQKNFFDD